MQQRELRPFFKFTWQLAGAWITVFLTAFVFCQLGFGYFLFVLICSCGLGIPAVIGYFWVREFTLPQVEKHSERRYFWSLYSTIAASILLPCLTYWSTLPVYLSEEELLAVFQQHRKDFDSLVELHKKNPKIELSHGKGSTASTDYSKEAQESRKILKRIFEDKRIESFSSTQKPLKITFSMKIPKEQSFVFSTQSIDYVEKIDSSRLVVPKDEPLVDRSRGDVIVYKKIEGNWYVCFYEYVD